MEFTWGGLIQDAKKASEPITEGQHRVRITDASAGQSSTGKLMFTIKTEILEGTDAKRKMTTNLTVSPENGTALAIFFQNMSAIGIPDTFFAQEPQPDQIAQAMIGREVTVVVKHETWQGVKRGKIDRWLNTGAGVPGVPTGPLAPGAVVGAPGPVLPTSSSSVAAAPTTPAVPTTPPAGAGPVAPSDAPPPLPI
jgi:hypothetical protein